jgi:hypothetical protein
MTQGLTYSDCAELKAAGFPQSGDNRDGNGDLVEISQTNGLSDEELDKLRLPGPTYQVFSDGTRTKISEKGIIPSKSAYVPLLDELIEECGDDFHSLVHLIAIDKWRADGFKDEDIALGDTRKQAVKNLYLALHSKK